MIFPLIISGLLVVIDQLVKYIVEKNLYGKSVDIISDIFAFTYLKNTGAAWGIFSNNNWILLILTPILIVFIFIFMYKYANSRLERIAGSLVLGGAVGNYIDRIFRGYVVDFIDFKIWPIFNMADIFIVVGCILFGISLIIKEKKM